jgi:hypothetical protein
MHTLGERQGMYSPACDPEIMVKRVSVSQGGLPNVGTPTV